MKTTITTETGIWIKSIKRKHPPHASFTSIPISRDEYTPNTTTTFRRLIDIVYIGYIPGTNKRYSEPVSSARHDDNFEVRIYPEKIPSENDYFQMPKSTYCTEKFNDALSIAYSKIGYDPSLSTIIDVPSEYLKLLKRTDPDKDYNDQLVLKSAIERDLRDIAKQKGGL